ncbi:hypothetical protein M514_23011 [Trichuris suis]|uniref:DUF4371 domain-containing protein n=1 Tax=Trichuris suis TaxID=68888 RepID=A0A085N5Q3_9BILA|nr:hypothetical protein M514_23011 [Trichuris suis]
MAKDVEDALCSILRRTQFSLQLDESTLPGNEAVLLAYVRFIKEEKFVQELLFARELVTDTKGESTFLILKDFFAEKDIPLTNIMSVATDGAPSMTGSHRGFIAYLKQIVPDILAIHCVIHRLRLVAKHLSARLSCSLELFRQLCQQNDEEYNRLLLHTEVRWLSKGDCLSRFYRLFETVLEFFEKHDVSLGENLKMFQSDIAYLCDLYSKFNEMNLHLQGDDLKLIRTKTVVCAFHSKLLLFKRNFARGEFSQFPNLYEMERRQKIQDEDVEEYCHHLELLHRDFSERFEDIISMQIPDWVLNPFSAAENAELNLQEELIELQMNEELKLKYKNGYQAFWLQPIIPDLYPGLWALVRQLLVAFPSSYLAERGFSVVTELLRKTETGYK